MLVHRSSFAQLRNPHPALACRAAIATLLMVAAGSASAQTVIGLTNSNSLLRFSATAPGAVPASSAVTGLQAGDTLVGLDIRPATGVLYALAASGRLYTIDTATSAATLAATLATAPSGTTFGVDFNPVADRLRVISNTGQSLRVNVADGVTVVDGSINPAGSTVAESAYTNSVAGTATTALYNIDISNSRLLLQSPPNDGTVVPVGALNVTIEPGTGFDVLTVGSTNTAYAALRVAATTGLYTIDLASGAATSIGAIGGNPTLIGITTSAAPLPGAMPAAGTGIGLDGGNNLVIFPTGAPAAVTATIPVTGLQGTDTLLDLDVRPATGALYGLAGSGRLYTIEPGTGIATLASTLSVALSGSNFAIDFNPVPDRLRVVSDTGQNLRINVDTGETIVDGAINPGGTQLAAVAYINSVAGATGTALYYLDAASDGLFLQNPPNAGTLVPVGATGVAFGSPAGFDVLTVSGMNSAYAVLTAGGASGLYQVDLISGAASLIGNVGGNPALRGFAISAAPVIIPGGPGGQAVALPVNSTFAMFLFALFMAMVGAVALGRRAKI